MRTTFTRFAMILLSIALMTSPAQAAFVKAASQSAAKMEQTTVPTAEEALFSDATKEFSSLSRHERRERIREAKVAFKDWRESGTADTNTLLLVILAILLPPLAVGIHQNGLTTKFWLSLLLWLLFYIPGLIYALLVIFGKA